MASSANLEERFNTAVNTIQKLPADGIIQPPNLTKLIIYGFYKQATLGPCKEPRPSVFNYIGRAKWDAWDRCRSMTKEQAMLAYIDEIRKLVETIPQTNEVLAFAQLIGLSHKSVEIQSRGNDSAVLTADNQQQATIITNDHSEMPIVNTIDATEILISSSSPSSSSSSSISSSDLDEFYDDPSDLILPNHDELVSNNNIVQQSTNTTRLHHSPHESGGQNRTNVVVTPSARGGNSHSNVPSVVRHHDPSNVAQYSTSSGSNNGLYPTNNYSRETQRAILTALTKLQRDINNILERLNRLETSTYLLQQRELSIYSQLNSSPRWLPLSGFRRGPIAFILFWPFIAFILIRLFLRANIIIRFRRQYL